MANYVSPQQGTEKEIFYKVAHMVLDEIPYRLRDFFKLKWDLKYQLNPWNDDIASGGAFLNGVKDPNGIIIIKGETNTKTKSTVKDDMQHGKRNSFDGTTLYAALLFSSHGLLVKDPNARIYIDSLRKLRNTHFAHLSSAEIDNTTYQQIVSDTKNIFQLMGWPCTGLTHIENSPIISGTVTGLLNRIKDEKLRNDDLLQRVSQTEIDIGQLKTDNTSSQANIHQLQTDNTSSKASIGQLQTDSASYKVSIDQLTTGITILKTDEENLKREMDRIGEGNQQMKKDTQNIREDTHGIKEVTQEILEIVKNSKDSTEEDYKKLEEIGRGMFAKVLKVKHVHDNKFYALKQSYQSLVAEDEKMAKSVKREVLTLAVLDDHKNVVRYFTSFVNRKKRFCIVMELCNSDLAKAFKDKDKEIKPRAIHIYQQIMNGLKYIHSLNIIHRDLKPANIFLCPDKNYRVKIGDFGLACCQDHPLTTHTGTKIYRAFEQEHGPYGNEVDIFASGIVFFELLKLREGDLGNWENWNGVLKDLRQKPGVVLKSFAPFRSKFTIGLIERLLERDPTKRPKAADVLSELTDLQQDVGGDFSWNQFKEITRIGYGKRGTVYKVTAMDDGKVYALKQTHFPPNGKDYERWENEIKAMQQLRHPYIVKYNRSFQDHEGKIYIQMEFFGKDLKECLDDSNLTLNIIRPQARRLLDQLLHGIDYIHSQGLIHRDLKPSNIFVGIIDGILDVKIGDFGLVSFKDDEMSSFTGAPLYRAPEQEFNEYDNKVDMYTLGIVLFDVLKKKYDGPVVWTKYIWNLRKHTKTTLEEFEPYQPKGWKHLISALLEIDPKGRPDAKSLLAKLNSLLSEDLDTANCNAAITPETNISDSSQEIKSKSSDEEEQDVEQDILLAETAGDERYQMKAGDERYPMNKNEILLAGTAGDERYPMNKNPRGICLIISNDDFARSDVDVQLLRELFGWLKFKVEVFKNLTALKMFDRLKHVAKVDHSESDCLIVCILTHGLLDGLYGIDGKPLHIGNITELYKGLNCPSLCHKPKLMFLQSSRGDATDKGFYKDGSDVMSRDAHPIVSNQQLQPIRPTDPIESDFFIGYPTPRGYTAWRRNEGTSWYIETLCSVFRRHAASHDLLSLMTIVNNEVSKKVTHNDDKQMPEPTFTLRKKLYFNP